MVTHRDIAAPRPRALLTAAALTFASALAVALFLMGGRWLALGTGALAIALLWIARSRADWLGLAAGIGTLLVVTSPAASSDFLFDGHVGCLVTACVVALLPALGVVVFVGSAAPYRPTTAVLAAAAGTASLGGMSTQLSCPHADALHLALGHASVPAVGVLLLVLPLLAALKRLRRS